MIKIYIDWNVMSQMKNGNHNDLQAILTNNKKLFIPYSTSHIGDIFSSFKDTEKQKKYIADDLKFISEFTNDACLFNTGKNIVMEFRSPQELFQEEVEENPLLQDISLTGLIKAFEHDKETGHLGVLLMEKLRNIPLDYALKDAFEKPEMASQLEIMFPGLKENPTMEGFFEAFNKMLLGLNEGDKYKDMRKIIQSGTGINRDKIFNDAEPFKTIDKFYEGYGTSWNANIDNSKNAPEWFNKISNEYIMLDMHGYQEDNVNIKKGRKETFKNTTEDAFHASFASTCHFYIINDNKSYKKTKQIYDRLAINTYVFKPEEFVAFYNDFLNIPNTEFNLVFPSQLMKEGKYIEKKLEEGVLRTYLFPQFIFNFFNKLNFIIPDNPNEQSIIILNQNGPTNKITLVIEIEHLVDEITMVLGEDIDRKGPLIANEFDEEVWIGRTWKANGQFYRLERNNGDFQFFINTDDKKSNKNLRNMIFNIYYINFPKVYEIKMMLSNIIAIGGELHHESAKGKDSEIRGKLGIQLLSLLSGEVESKRSTNNSDSQKVLETFEIKTTKSIILNEIIEKSNDINDFRNIREGELIKIDNIRLSLMNEAELRTVKIVANGSLKGMDIPGVNGLDINNLFNSMFKDYAYKMKGKIKNSEEELLVKIPLTFESEFESSYSVDDLSIGKVSLIGLYKGKIRIDSLKNSFEFFQEMGNTNKDTKLSSDIRESHSEHKKLDPFTGDEVDGSVEYHYIDLLAIIQNVSIPAKE